jgi:hypothetical protein
MDEIEAFLDECRADPWFQSHPEVVDRLESVLIKFYLAGEDPEWQAIWDQLHTILVRTPKRLLTAVRRSPRCSRPSRDSAAMADGSRRFPPPWRADRIPGGYVVRDANGRALAYIYSRDTEVEARQAKVLTKDEARRIAVNIARLPELLGKADRD